MTAPTAIAPVPLERVPEVGEFLTGLGLGVLREGEVSAFRGRNDSWAGVTSVGIPVFVKRVGGVEADVRRRVARIAAMGDLLDAHPVINVPRFLGGDETTSLVAFTLLEDARSASELGDDLSWKLARSAGVQLGTLHGLTPPSPVAEDDSAPPLPPLKALTAISMEMYQAASGAELESWAILHNDAEVTEAIGRLAKWAKTGPRVLTHGDLRLDQFLVHDDRLHLVDWEEARVADAARDVGAFAGEWLYRGVLGMATKDDGVSDREVVNNGARRFETLRPYIEAFWTGYLEARPAARDDHELAARAAGFAGWHMFDRVLAAGFERPRLTPLERAAAGVGRKVLLDPAAFTTTLGIGDNR
ncbi:class V lanthionine synthetase subunit LxmK [Herbidospora mongoliensis]|uniref:class V lanthionine synthetase subunit LxmK n=1 Tax=Herbidospora mongoliensis TaxID=688067 RepID=UPI00082A6EC4|nr:class V lanthionine synthetase subunit LxmK [Herbidospora mongoliensis]